MTGTTTTINAVVKLKVAPSHEVKHLAYLYTKAKRTLVKWLIKQKPAYKNDRELIEILHNNWYTKLKQLGLPLALIFDCYRDAKNVYKSWLSLTRKKREYPRLKRVSVIFTPNVTYSFDREKIKLTMLGREIRVLGYGGNLRQYKDWEIAEARLLKKENGWYLHVTLQKENNQTEFKLKDAVAVDVNEDFTMVGNDKVVMQIETRVNDALHYIMLAQNLQRKYPTKWRYSKRILNRIRHYYRRAGNILLDSAKKTAKWIIDIAEMLGANAVILENLIGLNRKIRNLSRKHRVKMILMQYRRLHTWVEWQGKKRGKTTVHIPAVYTSFSCPKCKAYMKLVEGRTAKCLNCGFEENRDYVAVMNLYGRGLSYLKHLSTAHRMSTGHL